jgi:epoxide hydrolase 4
MGQPGVSVSATVRRTRRCRAARWRTDDRNAVAARPRKVQMTDSARSNPRGPARFRDPLEAACPVTCPRLPDEERIGLRHRFVEANGVRFHLVEAGSGPLVLLLHGFLDFWYGWRDQIPALAERFRVVVPDLRGYNLSGKPTSGYDPDTLASDVTALISALGEDRAHLVGHSWGGIVAWDTAVLHPAMVDRLAVVNAPHPAAYQREWDRNPIQRLRSWYMLLFQVPGLPEWLLTRRHAHGLIGMLRRTTPRPGIFTPADLAAYRRAMLRPGAAGAALAYYRTVWKLSSAEIRARPAHVAAPTILIWGMQDVALVSALADDLGQWVPALHVERVADAGHWVHLEQPERVNRQVLRHLGQ